MSKDQSFVIVGAGHAGGRAAQAMRMAGFEGRITLIGEEEYIPYERPPLSKELLTTDEGLEKAQLNTAAYYTENNIDLFLGAAAQSIDIEGRQVTLSNGKSVGYDKLLLATGARVRKLPIPGADLDGVHYLRDYNDTLNIRHALRGGARVAVIGGGFIGLETAASARKRGCDVTVLEAADRLMARAVAPEIGQYFYDVHKAQGVDVRLGAAVEKIEGSSHVEGVGLADGTSIGADLVVIGIGIIPNTEIAAVAGLDVDNGIVVDEFGRTSDPDVFASGDVASLPIKVLGKRARLESYQNAQNASMAVARVMCGDETPYGETPWVWSDQYDINLQMVGVPETWDQLVYRGDVKAGKFTVFYLNEGFIVGVNTINNGREKTLSQRLMEAGKPVDPEKLADTSIRLNKIHVA